MRNVMKVLAARKAHTVKSPDGARRRELVVNGSGEKRVWP